MVKKKEVKFDVSQVKCPACNTAFYYYRAKSEDYMCRKCGSIFCWNINKGKILLKKEKKVKA